MTIQIEPTIVVVIFGCMGDLTWRKLAPAFYNLLLDQQLPEHFAVIGLDIKNDLGYFVTNQVFDNLSSSGNLLAIAWGMTAPAQGHAILDKIGEFQIADLERISTTIVRDGAVHEVYAPNGHHLSSLWYTSEAPLTWSAGMVVYAQYVYQRHLADG